MKTKTENNRSFPVPAGIYRYKEKIRQSRFIATIAPAPKPEDAKAFISKIRGELPDATHHCWAYVSGFPGDTAKIGMSDDGEPHGTAGRPMLNMLLHSGIGEIVAIVTRYFGGVKLGTGGLVRAYSGIVQTTLTSMPVVLKRHYRQLKLILGYQNVDSVKQLARSYNAEIINTQYHEKVIISFDVPVHRLDKFKNRITDITKGNALFEEKSV